MKHNYFNEEDVIDALGGLQSKYVQNRKTLYRLINGDLVVIRNNSQSADYYWYNVQRDLFHSDIKYVVCVAGSEGIYRIPMSIIADCAEHKKIGNRCLSVDELREHIASKRTKNE